MDLYHKNLLLPLRGAIQSLIAVKIFNSKDKKTEENSIKNQDFQKRDYLKIPGRLEKKAIGKRFFQAKDPF
ncbi:MAG: hypothetical protein DRN92_05645 [Thermoproteota archaeon]|nr:MAG: hypothetical protein DRN92_05645 [Candidatus Korarchaeota archaeon]